MASTEIQARISMRRGAKWVLLVLNIPTILFNWKPVVPMWLFKVEII